MHTGYGDLNSGGGRGVAGSEGGAASGEGADAGTGQGEAAYEAACEGAGEGAGDGVAEGESEGASVGLQETSGCWRCRCMACVACTEVEGVGLPAAGRVAVRTWSMPAETCQERQAALRMRSASGPRTPRGAEARKLASWGPRGSSSSMCMLAGRGRRARD